MQLAWGADALTPGDCTPAKALQSCGGELGAVECRIVGTMSLHQGGVRACLQWYTGPVGGGSWIKPLLASQGHRAGSREWGLCHVAPSWL